MKSTISKRLLYMVDALPLREGIRILEIGCGTGTAAREIATRFADIYIMGIDRSAKAIEQAQKTCKEVIEAGKIHFVQAAIENFDYDASDEKFDLAFAVRVGALDGRHPEIESQAITNIIKALKPGGKLFIDDGPLLKELDIRR